MRRFGNAAVLSLILVIGGSVRAEIPVSAESKTTEQDGYSVTTHVPYCEVDGVELRLDIAIPKGEGPFPGVICIHGGGWSGGQREVYSPVIRQLAAEGFVAATASYRLAPGHKFPAAIEDVKCSVRFLRAHAKDFKIDPRRIGATGGSAGGHLVALLGTTTKEDGLEGRGGYLDQSSRVSAVCDLYGPTDIVNQTWSDDDPPFLIFPGDSDGLVPVNQSKILHEALQKAGVPSELVIYEGADHGWGGEKMVDTTDRMIQFFKKYLDSVRGKRLRVQ
jgi:acetyl esterase/lipase